jgi:hypothetical protein
MLALLRIAKFVVFISFSLFVMSILPTHSVHSQDAGPSRSSLGLITARAFDTDNDAGGAITVEWDDPAMKRDGFAGSGLAH